MAETKLTQDQMSNILKNDNSSKEYIQHGITSANCTGGQNYIIGVITLPKTFTLIKNAFLTLGSGYNFTIPEEPVIIITSITNSQINYIVKTAQGGNWISTRVLTIHYMAIGE